MVTEGLDDEVMLVIFELRSEGRKGGSHVKKRGKGLQAEGTASAKALRRDGLGLFTGEAPWLDIARKREGEKVGLERERPDHKALRADSLGSGNP